MGKLFVPLSSTVFSIIIFVLLLLSVGLLVFVLKGQIQHENAMSSTEPIISDQPPKSTSNPQESPVTESNEIDVDHTSAASHPEDHPWEDFRLPKYILPVHYDLLLYPDLRNDTFSGQVNITVNVTRPTRHFVVHAYRLLVLQSRVYSGKTMEVEIKRSFLYDPHEYFVVETQHEVGIGQHVISFDFMGSLTGGIVGFYKSRYTDAQNQTRFLATSKFQPTYARRAFPCFDEPSFKSTFKVSLVHEPDYIALSNMPVQVIEQYSDLHLLVTRFQKSVPMVTYLSCFIVCDFDYTGTNTSNGKPFRVYATPHQVNKTKYAVKFGSRVLEYFEDYFGISYPLPKQDMVAIPDFVSGAMEHWGVITFRETNLLTTETSSPQHNQRVSTVIAHEMAHMWFGNLVTMDWWDDLWLNEGFASYVEYKGVDEQHPEWDMLAQFLTEDMQSVMDLDSTLSSHPIVQPVKHPDEITEIFDHISYAKGASVLRMLEFFVGKEKFRKGISLFLKKHQYRNARTSDLWEELHEACGLQGDRNISSIMNTWTIQMGFPYITVKRAKNSSVFTAYQMRFLKNSDSYKELHDSAPENIWSVPLSYITSKGKSGIIWIHSGDPVNFTLPLDTSEWVKFNVNQTGYYLVNYEEEEWERLTDLLKTNHEILSPSDRSNLLFDAFLLAEAGHISFEVYLGITSYLKHESHLIPWESAYTAFVYFGHLLEFTDTDSLLKNYVRELTDPLYKKLGWSTGNEHLHDLMQTTIIGLACNSGNEDCLSAASELFQNWTQGQEIPASLRTLVYHYGMAEIGREEHWNYMWKRYLAEESAEEARRLLYGLAHVRVPSLLQRYLEYAMDETKVRKQNFFTVLTNVAGNPIGRHHVWNFLREKWPLLVERYTLNDRYLGIVVKTICNYFTTDYQLQEMLSFFAKYPDAGAGKRRRQQALESVRNNIKWLQTHKLGVKNWLQLEGADPWLNYRLPQHIVPEHYDLAIYPDLEGERFNGSVAIDVRLDKPSDCFLVHILNLNVTATKVKSLPDDQPVTVDRTFEHEPNSYWVVKVDHKLPIGKYRLYFEFESNLTESLKGLYKVSYLHQRLNEKRMVASTQFESTHARRAFPCFDEPTFRTTFTVRLRHKAPYFALSNTMVEETVMLEHGLLETRFEKSVPMVTYLLCLVICDFEYKEAITENGLRFRVYATEHNINKTDYALGIGSKIVTYFEKYFDVAFPLKKLDMIAVPSVDSGGMENWGLITYSEDAMLCGPDSSLRDMEGIAVTVSHELAHMWFGNLVTMKWWDDLWLNEGFASYISTMGVQHVEPTWDMDNRFLTRGLYGALARDCSINSHPIVQNIRKANEISEMFDFVSYNKGASVLRMLENLMEEDFRVGVSAYLKKYAFGNAQTEDLWVELTAASKKGLNISSLMNTWTRQMNYPYISVKRHEGVVTISQHHFLGDPQSKFYYQSPSPYGYVWQVPLTYHTSENKALDFMLLNSTNEASISLPDSAWIKLNANFTGYFLVNYDEQDWRRFSDMLEDDPHVFNPSDRTNLLFDSFSLASSGDLSYDVPLNLSHYLTKETHFAPLTIAVAQLNKIKNYLKPNPETRELMTEYLRVLSKDLMRKYTWNDTGDNNEKKMRSVVIELACNNKNYECLTTAANLLKKAMKGEVLSPNLRNSAYKYGMMVLKDEDTWNFMWNKLITEPDQQQKEYLMLALAMVRNDTLLKRYAELAENEDYVKRHEYFDVLMNIAANPQGRSFVTEFLFNNWTQLIKKHKSERRVESFARGLFGMMNSEDELKRVQEFHRKHRSLKLSGRLRRETIEQIKNNIRLFKQHHAPVENWLRENIYMPWRELRLPSTTTPTLYDIKIHPNISLSTFEGSVEVEVNVSEPTDFLVVHQKKLEIHKTELTAVDGGQGVIIDEAFPYDKNQFWVIRLADVVPAGVYLLQMVFSGVMEDEGFGLGRYSYKHKTLGETRYAGLTMFEPTNARKAFPCFDEPTMKAKFKLTIVHESVHSALSNMPEEVKRERPDGLVETSFQETVPMSTYLLCYLISDYAYLETEYRGKKIRTYAPPDRVHLTEHSLNFTVKVLEFFEDFYDITYTLPKLDSVSVKGYAPNGMEHWGLVFYKESRFLVEDSFPRKHILEEVDVVIAHELAHQWFGNLVTMKWWSDVWLNEGFSTFAQYVALEQFYPEAQETYVKDIALTMKRDSYLDCHPIIADASHPEEIISLFDDISYRKGAAVLKMLDYTLKDDFRKGVTNYLKKFAFGNTDTKDLWNELSLASNSEVNITEVMDTWTIQMGFPFIEIEKNDGLVTATQRWFINDEEEARIDEAVRKNPYEYMWKIPLVYKDINTGHEQSYWLNERTATFVTNTSKDALLKFNPEFMGFYIVKYEDDDWKRFADSLHTRHEDFAVTDRYNLLHDAIRLAASGRLLFDIPFEMAKYLKKEHNLLPWEIFLQLVRDIFKKIDVAGETFPLLLVHLKDLSSELYDQYAEEKGDFAVFIKDVACYSYNEKCLQVIQDEFQQWMQGNTNTSIPLGTILSISAEKLGTSDIYQQMYEQFFEETEEDFQESLAEALGSFRDPSLINRTLELTLFDPEVSTFLAQLMYKSMMRNPKALPMLFEMMRNNWPLLKNRLGEGIATIPCSNFKTVSHLSEILQFYKLHPELDPQDTADCIAKIQKTIEWSDKYEENLLSWLRWNDPN